MKGKSIFSTLVFGIIFGLGMVVAYVVRSDEHAVDSVLITACRIYSCHFCFFRYPDCRSVGQGRGIAPG